MKLQDLLKFASDFMSPGAAHAPTVRHHGVMSPHMKKTAGHTRPTLGHPAKGGKGEHGHLRKGVRTHFFTHKIHLKPQGKGHESIRADSSASDLASHHTWQEPSASDLTIKNWQRKRQIEKVKRRNLDPFEEGARMAAAKVTGPCGCTLELGERVVVEGIGKGKIKSREDRMLTVALDNGHRRVIDQKFVHRLARG